MSAKKFTFAQNKYMHFKIFFMVSKLTLKPTAFPQHNHH